MSTVSRRIALWSEGEDNHRPLPALISYVSTDPYCLRLAFLGANGRVTLEWEFARELLVFGLITAVGDGDVRIEPALRGEDLDLGVRIALIPDSVDEPFTLWTPSAPLWRFLRDTYALVPLGAESRLLDVDAVINRLLADPGEVAK